MFKICGLEELNIVGIIITILFLIVLISILPISNKRMGDSFIRITAILTKAAEVIYLKKKLELPVEYKGVGSETARKAEEYVMDKEHECQSGKISSLFKRVSSLYHPLLYLVIASSDDRKYNLLQHVTLFRWVIILLTYFMEWFLFSVAILVYQAYNPNSNFDDGILIILILAGIVALGSQPFIFLMIGLFQFGYKRQVARVFAERSRIRRRRAASGISGVTQAIMRFRTLNISDVNKSESIINDKDSSVSPGSTARRAFLMEADRVLAAKSIAGAEPTPDDAFGEDSKQFWQDNKKNDDGLVEKLTVSQWALSKSIVLAFGHYFADVSEFSENLRKYLNDAIVITMGLFAGFTSYAIANSVAYLLLVGFGFALLFDTLILRAAICFCIAIFQACHCRKPLTVSSGDWYFLTKKDKSDKAVNPMASTPALDHQTQLATETNRMISQMNISARNMLTPEKEKKELLANGKEVGSASKPADDSSMNAGAPGSGPVSLMNIQIDKAEGGPAAGDNTATPGDDDEVFLEKTRRTASSIEDYNKLLLRRIYSTYDSNEGDSIIKNWKTTSLTEEIQAMTPQTLLWEEAKNYAELVAMQSRIDEEKKEDAESNSKQGIREDPSGNEMQNNNEEAKSGNMSFTETPQANRVEQVEHKPSTLLLHNKGILGPTKGLEANKLKKREINLDQDFLDKIDEEEAAHGSMAMPLKSPKEETKRPNTANELAGIIVPEIPKSGDEPKVMQPDFAVKVNPADPHQDPGLVKEGNLSGIEKHNEAGDLLESDTAKEDAMKEGVESGGSLRQIIGILNEGDRVNNAKVGKKSGVAAGNKGSKAEKGHLPPKGEKQQKRPKIVEIKKQGISAKAGSPSITKGGNAAIQGESPENKLPTPIPPVNTNVILAAPIVAGEKSPDKEAEELKARSNGAKEAKKGSQSHTAVPARPTEDAAIPIQPAGDVATPMQPTGDAATPMQPTGGVATPMQPAGDAVTPMQPTGDIATPMQPTGDATTPVHPSADNKEEEKASSKRGISAFPKGEKGQGWMFEAEEEKVSAEQKILAENPRGKKASSEAKNIKGVIEGDNITEMPVVVLGSSKEVPSAANEPENEATAITGNYNSRRAPQKPAALTAATGLGTIEIESPSKVIIQQLQQEKLELEQEKEKTKALKELSWSEKKKALRDQVFNLAEILDQKTAEMLQKRKKKKLRRQVMKQIMEPSQHALELKKMHAMKEAEKDKVAQKENAKGWVEESDQNKEGPELERAAYSDRGDMPDDDGKDQHSDSGIVEADQVEFHGNFTYNLQNYSDNEQVQENNDDSMIYYQKEDLTNYSKHCGVNRLIPRKRNKESEEDKNNMSDTELYAKIEKKMLKDYKNIHQKSTTALIGGTNKSQTESEEEVKGHPWESEQERIRVIPEEQKSDDASTEEIIKQAQAAKRRQMLKKNKSATRISPLKSRSARQFAALDLSKSMTYKGERVKRGNAGRRTDKGSDGGALRFADQAAEDSGEKLRMREYAKKNLKRGIQRIKSNSPYAELLYKRFKEYQPGEGPMIGKDANLTEIRSKLNKLNNVYGGNTKKKRSKTPGSSRKHLRKPPLYPTTNSGRKMTGGDPRGKPTPKEFLV